MVNAVFLKMTRCEKIIPELSQLMQLGLIRKPEAEISKKWCKMESKRQSVSDHDH